MFGAAFVLATAAVTASAQVKVGVIVGSTGPQASLGGPMRNTFSILPDTLGGQSVKYIIMDDTSDPTNSVRLARKLASEDNVDLIFGTSSLAGTTAIAHVAAELEIPQLGLSPVGESFANNPWVFTTPQPLEIMMSAPAEHMKANNVKTIAYIGYADSWGELVLSGLKPHLETAGVELIADERYGRSDTSVVAQVLKIIATQPDAVVIGGSGTGSALPNVELRERGYEGPIYHNHAVINHDFVRIGGKSLEGVYATSGPLMVAEQLADDNPIKEVALSFLQPYEAKYGTDSRNAFSGYSYDAYLLADTAVRTAAKTAKPGTPEFRRAVREALESDDEVVGTHGVYDMTPTDHAGLDERARVLVQIEDGKWKVVQ